MTMETFRRGWTKRHKGECGGIVVFKENTDIYAHWEWDFLCEKCHKELSEENVVFERRKDIAGLHDGS